MKIAMDIGSKQISTAVRHSDCIEQDELINRRAELNRFFARMARLDGKTEVIMEHTGVYHWDAALAAHQAGLGVMLCNPKNVSHFGKAMNARSKTDKLDARLLLEYAERMPFVAWQPPRQAVLELRVIARHLLALTEQMSAMKCRLHASEVLPDTPKFVLRDYRDEIKRLKTRIDKGTEEALKRVNSDDELNAQFKALDSIVGIGTASAIATLAELAVLPTSMSARACAAHAGLDVRHHQSGTSICKPGRLGKQGNAYLRRALYMPALVAVRHDPHAKAHYEHLQARGKKKMQALCAIMRKLLTAAWAMIKSQQNYDGSKLFAIKIS